MIFCLNEDTVTSATTTTTTRKVTTTRTTRTTRTKSQTDDPGDFSFFWRGVQSND